MRLLREGEHLGRLDAEHGRRIVVGAEHAVADVEVPHAAVLRLDRVGDALKLDVVVEGTAVRVGDNAALQRIADAYEAKYGSVWHFDVGDGVFGEGERAAAVFRVEPAKVMAFAKQPHAQTTYRFGRS